MIQFLGTALYKRNAALSISADNQQHTIIEPASTTEHCNLEHRITCKPIVLSYPNYSRFTRSIMSAEVQHPDLSSSLIKAQAGPSKKGNKKEKLGKKGKKDDPGNDSQLDGGLKRVQAEPGSTAAVLGSSKDHEAVASKQHEGVSSSTAMVPGAKGMERADVSLTDRPKSADDDSDAALAELEAELSSGSSDSDALSNDDEDVKKKRREAKRERKEGETQEQKKERRRRKTEQERRQRVGVDNEGIVGFIENRKERNPPVPRPKEVEKLWKTLFPLVKSWWELGGKPIPTSHEPSIEKVQHRIGNYCKRVEKDNAAEVKAARDTFNEKWPNMKRGLQLAHPDKSPDELKGMETAARKALKDELGAWTVEELQTRYRFPSDLLQPQITALGQQMKEVHDLPSVEILQKRLSELASEESQSSGRNKVAVGKEIAEIKKKMARTQKASTVLLQGTLIFMDQLYNLGIPPSDVISSKANTIFFNFIESSKGNQKLYQELKRELEKPTLDQLDTWEVAALPIYKVVEAVNDRDSMRTKEQIDEVGTLVETIKVHNTKMQKMNTSRGIGEDVNTIPMSLIHQMQSDWNDGQDERARKSLKKFMKLLMSTEHTEKVVTAIESGVAPIPTSSEHAENVTATETGIAPILKSHEHTEKQARRKGPTSTNPTTLHKSHALGKRSLLSHDISSFKPRTIGTPSYNYENGETEFGPLVATRPSRTDNARFSRFFVNSGLDVKGYEYIRVVRGSEMSLGAAEQLEDQKVVEVDVYQRKRDIKKKKYAIDKVGPAVQMEHCEDYTPTGRPRRMDMYIKVTYRGRNDVDFLTRTEFTQLVGKRDAERGCKAHLENFEETRIHMEACREQRKHPITLRDLTKEDFAKTPWLFSESEKRLGFKEKRVQREEEDEEMGEDDDEDADESIEDNASDDEDTDESTEDNASDDEL